MIFALELKFLFKWKNINSICMFYCDNVFICFYLSQKVNHNSYCLSLLPEY